MKLPLLFTVIFFLSGATPGMMFSVPACQSSAPTKAEADKDTQVVAETMSTMITALATFSQDPHNPVVAGACALQALGAFIKMLIQIFDDFAPTRTMRSAQEIEDWFLQLPKEKRIQIMKYIRPLSLVYKKISESPFERTYTA